MASSRALVKYALLVVGIIWIVSYLLIQNLWKELNGRKFAKITTINPIPSENELISPTVTNIKPELEAAPTAVMHLSNQFMANKNTENTSVRPVSLLVQSNFESTELSKVIKRNLTNAYTVKDVVHNCSLWSKEAIEEPTNIQPLILLDVHKFLYPGLLYGPNNQLHGFWQSVYLAIRLNRTLVLPRFASHYTNGRTWISPHQRIDIQRLSRFLSIISLEKFKHTCDGSFDAAFQAMEVSLANIRNIEESSGMNLRQIPSNRIINDPQATRIRLTNKAPNMVPNIPTYPRDHFVYGWRSWAESDEKSLRMLYNSTAKCAVFVSPYRNIKLPLAERLPLPPSTFFFQNSTDLELYTTIVQRINAPRCIVEAAHFYTENNFDNGSFVGIHWRFNENDWLGRCNYNLNKLVSQICKGLPNITAHDVAQGVINELTKNNVSISDWSRVYIAVPPNLRKFQRKINEAFSVLNPYFKQTGQDILPFLSYNFNKCWKRHNWNNVEDVASMVEQEIIIQSKWFFYSDISTWSANIRPARLQKSGDGVITRKFEASAFNVAQAAMYTKGKEST